MIAIATCPVCGGARLAPYTYGRWTPGTLHFAQARCDACRLVIAQPQADAADMDRYYRDMYYQRDVAARNAEIASNEVQYRHHELPLMNALWADWPPPAGGSILEIGCGFGSLLGVLAAQGYKAVGCDPSTAAVASCRARGLDVVEGSVPNLPFTRTFDATIAQHVVEHVADPKVFVRALVERTTPGGVVVLVTEDAWNAQWGWERTCARVRGRIPRFHTSTDHTYVFNARHLTRLLQEAGCSAVNTRSFTYTPGRESPHWRLYKGAFRTLDRILKRGDFLMAVGRVTASQSRPPARR